MAQNTDNVKRLHESLSSKVKGFTVPYEQFAEDMKDEAKLKTLHGNLSKMDGFTVPYEQFKTDMLGESVSKVPYTDEDVKAVKAEAKGVVYKPDSNIEGRMPIVPKEELSYQKDMTLPYVDPQPVKDYMSMFSKRTPTQVTAEKTGVSEEVAAETGEAFMDVQPKSEKRFYDYKQAKIYGGFKTTFPEYSGDVDEIVKLAASGDPDKEMQASSRFEQLRQSVIGDERYGKYAETYVFSEVDDSIERLISDTKKISEIYAKSDKNNVLQNFGTGVGVGVEQYVKGYTELLNRMNDTAVVRGLEEKIRKFDSGENVKFSEEEKILMMAMDENFNAHKQIDGKLPSSYNIGVGVGGSIGFIGEFILAGGIAKAALAPVEGLVTAGRIGGAVSPLTRGGMILAEVGIRNAAMPSTYQKMADRVAQGESGASAFINAYTENLGEVISEYAFMGQGKAGKGVLNEFLRKAGLAYSTEKGVLGMVKGFGEEYTEEKLAEIYNAPKDYDSFSKFFADFINVKKNLETFGTVTVLGGTLTAPSIIGNSVAKVRSDVVRSGLQKRLPTEITGAIDQIFQDNDIGISDAFALSAEVIYDALKNGTIEGDYNQVVGDALRYANEVAKAKVRGYVEKSKPEEILPEDAAVIPTVEPVEITPEVSAEVSEQQKQVDYLKSRGQVIPDGTDMETLNKMFSAEKTKERTELNTEIDTKVKAAQEKLGLPQTPDIEISEDTEATLERLDEGLPVTNEFIKSASDELYGRYRELEAMKTADTRLYTTEQIESMQGYLEEEIKRLESYAIEQKETGKFVSEVESGKVAEGEAAGVAEGVSEVVGVSEKPVEAVSEKGGQIVPAEEKVSVKPYEDVQAAIDDIERRRQEELEIANAVSNEKIKKGRELTKQLIDSLKERYPATTPKGIIVRILEKLVDFNNYSVIVDSEYLDRNNANGQATWYGMLITQDALDGILSGKEYDVHTFIHEIIHGFTTNKLSDYNIISKGLIPGFKSELTAREISAIEQLQRIFEKVKKDNPTSKEYAFKNLDEFIAEAFSNESFQYTLKSTQSEGKKSNLFRDFVSAIGDIFYEQLERWAKRFNKEIPSRDTITGILEDVLAWSEELIDQNNKLSYVATVDEINAKYDAELEKLKEKEGKEDAVQVEKAVSVSVEPAPGVGKEVEGRTPEAKPEEVAGEKKEVKKESDDKKRKRRLQRTDRQPAANGQPIVGKGETSAQGVRLVDGTIVKAGDEVVYKGETRKVKSVKGDVVTIPGVGDVHKSKVLAPTKPVVDTRGFNLEETNPNKVNDDLLSDEVFDKMRMNNIEPSDTDVLGTAALAKSLMNGDVTVEAAINEAVDRFAKRGTVPDHVPFFKAAPGAKQTSPYATYNDAVRGQDNAGKNLWVRNTPFSTNKNRVLLVQFSSNFLYGKQPFKRDKNSSYFDKLYRLVAGYNRTVDFWEVPLWMARIAGLQRNADVYVVRDIEEAKKFINEAGYESVHFSALDVNEKHIVDIIGNTPGTKYQIGGYTDFKRIEAFPNVTVYKSIDEYVKNNKLVDIDGTYSYRHFKGTAVIPRLKLSEGCLYKCAFCSIPKKVIPVKKEWVDSQIESIKDLDATLVYLDDKTFGQAENYTLLPELYERIKEYNPDFKGFIVQTTALDFANKKRFSPEYLKTSHIQFVELGVETYNDDILTKLNKKHSHKKFVDAAMQNARENNIKVIPNIIVGLSWNEGTKEKPDIKTETRETYQNTLDFLDDNKDIISHVNVYSLALYEGTELSDSIEVKEEADKNENIIAKSWQENKEDHEWAMDEFSDFASNQIQKKDEIQKEEKGLRDEKVNKRFRKISKQTGTDAKTVERMYNTLMDVFGLSQDKALAGAVIVDRMVGTMAKRTNKTKEQVYATIKWEKGVLEEIMKMSPLMQSTLWHGSPYQFDKFTTEKIGTGEGAQAFGWGLYFTELEGVARYYAKKLGKRNVIIDDSIKDNPLAYELVDDHWEEYEEMNYSFRGFVDEFIRMSTEQIEKAEKNLSKVDQYVEDERQRIEEIKNELAANETTLSKIDSLGMEESEKERVKGRLQERVRNLKSFVNFNAEQYKAHLVKTYTKALENGRDLYEKAKFIDDNFDKYKKQRVVYKVTVHKGKDPSEYSWVDWNKKLSPANTKKIIEQFKKEGYTTSVTLRNGNKVLNVEKDGEKFTIGLETGYAQFVYEGLALQLGDQKDASLFLLRAGIDGIRFPAESLSGKPTRGFNFVVFDENAVTIEEAIKFQQNVLGQARGEKLLQVIGEHGFKNMSDAVGSVIQLVNLSSAKDMMRDGKSAIEIKAATGWEIGVDKLWRYEIPDGKFTISRDDVEASPKDKDGNVIYKLGDIYDAPDLYKSYPDARNIEVVFSSNVQINTAKNDVVNNRIWMSNKEFDPMDERPSWFRHYNANQIIGHEIQHFIQRKEGFSEGGSAWDVLKYVPRRDFDATRDAIQTIRSYFDPVLRKYYKISDESLSVKKEIEQRIGRELTTDDTPQGGEYDSSTLDSDRYSVYRILGQFEEELANKYPSYRPVYEAKVELAKQYKRVGWRRGAHIDAYNRLAGEVEARNVMKRMNLSSKERGETLLSMTEDVGRKDQLVIRGAMNMMSGIATQNVLGKARGAMMFLDDANAVIMALTDPNVTTPLHELAHVYEKYLTAKEKEQILKWTGEKSWSVNTSESFARGFERFLYDGTAPGNLKAIFQKFAAWLKDIYKTLVASEINITLNEDMRRIYSTMLGSEYVEEKVSTAAPETAEEAADAFFGSAPVDENGNIILSDEEIADEFFGGLEVDENGVIKFQFIGATGAARLDAAENNNNRIFNLREAMKMADANKTAEEIKLATGWEKGKDNRWRYEIPDNMKMRPAWDKLKVSDYDNKHELPITEAMDYPELFAAYPEFEKIKIRKDTAFLDIFQSVQGWYDPDNMELIISPYATNPFNTVLHELQHAVQETEGFATGTNADEVIAAIPDFEFESVIGQLVEKLEGDVKRGIERNLKRSRVLSVLTSKEEEAIGRYSKEIIAARAEEDAIYNSEKKRFPDKNPYLENARIAELKNIKQGFRDKIGDIIERILGERDITLSTEFSYGIDAVEESIEATSERVIEDNKAVRAIKAGADRASIIKNFSPSLGDMAYNYYKRVAGETEARNVATRAKLTPEQRRSTAESTEDIPRTQQIVMRGGKVVSMDLGDKYVINPKERTSWRGYNVGDVIDGSKLNRLSGGDTAGGKWDKYVLVQDKLSNYNYDFGTILEDWGVEYTEDERGRLDKMKENFYELPPVPQSGDGLHRIVAAKELGHTTILMWKKVETGNILFQEPKTKRDIAVDMLYGLIRNETSKEAARARIDAYLTSRGIKFGVDGGNIVAEAIARLGLSETVVEAPVRPTKSAPSERVVAERPLSGKVKESKLGIRVIDGESAMPQNIKTEIMKGNLHKYDVFPDEVADATAGELYRANGLDGSIAIFSSRENRLHAKLEVFLGAYIVEGINREISRAEKDGRIGDANYWATRMVNFTKDYIATVSVERAQGLAALNSARVQSLFPSRAFLMKYEQDVSETRKTAMDTRTFKRKVKQVKADGKKAHKEVINDVLEDLNKKLGAIKEGASLRDMMKQKKALLDELKARRKNPPKMQMTIPSIPGLDPVDVAYGASIASVYIQAGVYGEKLVKGLVKDFKSIGVDITEEQAEKMVPDVINVGGVEVSVDDFLDELEGEKEAMRLANRIFGAITPKKETKDPLTMMLNTLMAKFNERNLNKPERRKVSDIEKIGEAIRDKEHYAETWAEARKIALDMIEANEEMDIDQKEIMSKMIDDAYDKATSFVFSEGQVDRAIRAKMKDMGMVLADIVRSHFDVQVRNRGSLTEAIIIDAGIDRADAEMLARAIERRYDSLMSEHGRRLIKKYTQHLTPTQKRSVGRRSNEERLLELINIGAFDDPSFVDAFASARGLVTIDPVHVRFIKEQADQINKQKSRILRLQRTEYLLGYMANLQGVSLSEIGDAVWYASVLSGMSTQVRNIIGGGAGVGINLATEMLWHPSYVPAMMRGIWRGIKFGKDKAEDVLKYGYSPYETRVETPRVVERLKLNPKAFTIPMIAHVFNNLKYVSRFMAAADMFNVTAGKEAWAELLALENLRLNDQKVSGLDYMFDSKYRKQIRSAINTFLGVTKEQMDAIRAEVEADAIELGYTETDKKIAIIEGIEMLRPGALVEVSTTMAVKSTGNTRTYGMIGFITDRLADVMNGVGLPFPKKTKTGEIGLGYIYPFKYVAAFTKIVSNVGALALEYVPGAAMPRYITGAAGAAFNPEGALAKRLPMFGKYYHKLSETERKAVLHRQIVGMVFTAAMVALSDPGDDDDPIIQITADGTGDWNKNNSLKDWKAYSLGFKVGDKRVWVPFRYTPLILALAPIGWARDRMKYSEKHKDAPLASMLTRGYTYMPSFLADMTAIQSMNEMLNNLFTSKFTAKIAAVFEPEEGIERTQMDKFKSDISSILMDVVGSFRTTLEGFYTPGVYRDMVKIWENLTQKELEMPANELKKLWARNPVSVLDLSPEGIVYRDVLGRPTTRPWFLSEFLSVTDKEDIMTYHTDNAEPLGGVDMKRSTLPIYEGGKLVIRKINPSDAKDAELWDYYVERRGYYLLRGTSISEEQLLGIEALKAHGVTGEEYQKAVTKLDGYAKKAAKEDVMWMSQFDLNYIRSQRGR